MFVSFSTLNGWNDIRYWCIEVMVLKGLNRRHFCLSKVCKWNASKIWFVLFLFSIWFHYLFPMKGFLFPFFFLLKPFKKKAIKLRLYLPFVLLYKYIIVVYMDLWMSAWESSQKVHIYVWFIRMCNKQNKNHSTSFPESRFFKQSKNKVAKKIIIQPP